MSIEFIFLPISFILRPLRPKLYSKSMSLLSKPFSFVNTAILKSYQRPNFFTFSSWPTLVFLFRCCSDLHFTGIIISCWIMNNLYFILWLFKFCNLIFIFIIIKHFSMLPFLNAFVCFIFKLNFTNSYYRACVTAATMIVTHCYVYLDYKNR